VTAREGEVTTNEKRGSDDDEKRGSDDERRQG